MSAMPPEKTHQASPPPRERRCVLAVDLGLSTGLALYNEAGRLCWHRSQHYADAAALRRAVHSLLGKIEGLTHVCVEGGGPLAVIWERESNRRGIQFVLLAAETWRTRLLLDREQRSGPQAKRRATDLARRVIEWSGAMRPKVLRHDAAEAILIGLWFVLERGWLARPVPELRVR